jgi:hypothetical protein
MSRWFSEPSKLHNTVLMAEYLIIFNSNIRFPKSSNHFYIIFWKKFRILTLFNKIKNVNSILSDTSEMPTKTEFMKLLILFFYPD